ncbi:hypothetical protein RAMDARK_1792 [Rickettsia amblyommatis str. Darkwater]|uniref:Uncharacterized protein n=1 Tax=Rickettsia amblyommatis str. Ac/Pa TaxID=1359164 RepID=A0A0F3N0Z7_RICAM|nr:hypothetical protein APHACPA_0694 [Rickettsia amblyommatis str. Ac/Pa]KJV99874.1 hypothetical protein RAMDARK_1792 [Rickettsia amblyommatis str. Darkwater]
MSINKYFSNRTRFLKNTLGSCVQKIKLFVFLDIFEQKLIRTQEPNISFFF